SFSWTNHTKGSRLYTLNFCDPVGTAGSGYHCDWSEYCGLVQSGTPRSRDLIWLVTITWISVFKLGRLEIVAPMMFASNWTEGYATPPGTVVLMAAITE